jgi:isochorismate synthase
MNAIAERRLDKVVAARRAAMAACPGSRFDAPATAARLQAAHPRAITFAIERQDEAFVGCTPELLARVDGARIESCALAGTAPAQAAQSLSSAKTLHEHRVVLDAVARGLDALCDAVTVDPLSPERAGTVQHLRARLRGRLRQGASLLDAVERLHPTPALGGAPRRDALDWLAAHEGFDRGLYGGPIGWLAPSGEGVMAVAIRSALLGREQALAFAGAGIVAGSEPEAEWRETEDKLATILGALTTKRTTA